MKFLRTSRLSLQTLVAFNCLLLATSAYEGCMFRYGRRGCFQRVLHGVLVTCDGLHQESLVPSNLPADTVYLSLVNFRLKDLKRANFTRFSAVECLTITDSGVFSIARDTFSEMDNLHELVLENTEIRNGRLDFLTHPEFRANLVKVERSPYLGVVNISASHNLRELKSISFQNNQLQGIDGRIFGELRNTETLLLSFNLLHELDWSSLKEMTKLNKLALDHNAFQTIPESMHSVFFAVKQLYLAGNPFHCNCKLRWLREFFHSVVDKELDFSEVMCASPHDMLMSVITERDFLCSRPSVPIIELLRVDSQRYEINCSSTGDPAPTLQITLPDDRSVITPPSRELAKVSTVTPQLLSMPGVVTCEASNSEGKASVTKELPAIVVGSAGRVSVTGWILLLASMAAVYNSLSR